VERGLLCGAGYAQHTVASHSGQRLRGLVWPGRGVAVGRRCVRARPVDLYKPMLGWYRVVESVVESA